MKATADLEVGLMSAVKTLKGVTLALIGFGQSLRVARRGVERAKGRKKGRRGMRKCIFGFWVVIFWFKGGCQRKGIGKLERDIGGDGGVLLV